MVSPTPKFKSRELKDVLAQLKEIFDAHSLSITILDGLERRVEGVLVEGLGGGLAEYGEVLLEDFAVTAHTEEYADDPLANGERQGQHVEGVGDVDVAG